MCPDIGDNLVRESPDGCGAVPGRRAPARWTIGRRAAALTSAAPLTERDVLFVADRDVRIVTEDGQLLRSLVLDPTRDYQRQSA